MKTSVFAIALIFLCSCSNVPKSKSYWITQQQKMQAAHHWDVLAEDVAKEVKLALQDPNALPGEQIYLGPIYVEPHKGSLFGKVFDTLLITQLVNQKIELAKNKSNSLKLKYGTQVVVHKSARHTSPFYPGMILSGTALGHGIYKIFKHHSDTWGLLAAAGAAEIINDLEHDWNCNMPHHEIVITTELTRDNTVIHRESTIYYINDADFWHYANSWHNNRGEEEELPIKKYSCVSE